MKLISRSFLSFFFGTDSKVNCVMNIVLPYHLSYKGIALFPVQGHSLITDTRPWYQKLNLAFPKLQITLYRIQGHSLITEAIRFLYSSLLKAVLNVSNKLFRFLFFFSIAYPAVQCYCSSFYSVTFISTNVQKISTRSWNISTHRYLGPNWGWGTLRLYMTTSIFTAYALKLYIFITHIIFGGCTVSALC